MNWYPKVLKNKYADFDGRAHREEFWMFTAVNIGVTIAVSVVAFILHLWILRVLYALAVLIPSIAVAVRRLHDTDRTGWWLLIALVPLVGIIVLIIFYVQDSYPDGNQYGPNPKADNAQ